ncbi:Zinc finger protein CONSTANS-LIKE 5 [Platanthera zijinensis]|uniref:Zinc finger protein CONSTANS-LIKE 5 n=1 Tax=Platanthera zijinensis TaxID=2320716 RepID=A0AAP0G3F7_9ASPA
MLQDMIRTPEQISIHDCISSPLSDEIFGIYDQGFFEDTVDSQKMSSPTANTTKAISTATTPAATATIACASIEEAADLSCYDHNFTSTYSPFDSSLVLSGLLDSQSLPDPKPNIQQPKNISASPPLSMLPMNSTYTQCSANQLDQMTPTYTPCSTNQLDEMIATGFTPYPSVPTVSQLPLGYMGLDPSSLLPNLFLDAGDFYASRAGMSAYGDGKMGLFGNGNRALALAEARTGAAEACDAMIYAPGSMQELYSSGDLQALRDGQYLAGRCSGSSNSLSPTSDISRLDDSTYKVGRLTTEERREKIHRYMKKRNERNFSKKIKYACRKTLADSRPRVRGRFAKNDEFGEAAPRPCSAHREYDDEDECDEIMVKHEEDTLESLDIQSHISGANSFNYNYTVESWI